MAGQARHIVVPKGPKAVPHPAGGKALPGGGADGHRGESVAEKHPFLDVYKRQGGQGFGAVPDYIGGHFHVLPQILGERRGHRG